MLHYNTVDAQTLELLNQLSNLSSLAQTRLAGGTSLALQLGHRKSVDIDMFGSLDDDIYTLIEQINKLGEVTTLQNTTNIHIWLINGIKVDVVNYPYPWLENYSLYGTLRLASKSDIAAMKLSAITGRGSKKDFIDLYFLLMEYSLHDLLDLYKTKYRDGSVFLVLKSLTYFDDAENEQNPFMLKSIDWSVVRKFIISQVDNYHNRYLF